MTQKNPLRISLYSEGIAAATGETNPDVLREIEDIMRHDIFHSTLDWQTREELDAAAREANEIRMILLAEQIGLVTISYPPPTPKGEHGNETRRFSIRGNSRAESAAA